MRLSNTGFRPPVRDRVTAYEIPPIGLRPLVESPLQNDDSRVTGRPHLRTVRRHCITTRTAWPWTRPGANRTGRTWSTRVSRNAGLGDDITAMDEGSTAPALSTTNRTSATPPMMGLAPPLRTVTTPDSAESGRGGWSSPRHSGTQLYSVSSGSPTVRRASAAEGRAAVGGGWTERRTVSNSTERSESICTRPATSSRGSIVSASRNDPRARLSLPLKNWRTPRHTSAFTRSRPVAIALESSASPTSTSPESTLPAPSWARAAITRSAARACPAATGVAPRSKASARPAAIVAALIERLTYAAARPSASRPEGEGDRKAHQYPHRPAVGTPRPEHRAEHVRPRGRVEAGVRALQRKRARLGPAQGIDHDLDHHGSRGPAAPQHLWVRERRTGEERRRIVHRGGAPRTIRRTVHAAVAHGLARAAQQRLGIEVDAGVDRRETDGGLGRHIDRWHVWSVYLVGRAGQPVLHRLGPHNDHRRDVGGGPAVRSQRRQHDAGAHARMRQHRHGAAGHPRSSRDAIPRCDQFVEHGDPPRARSPYRMACVLCGGMARA